MKYILEQEETAPVSPGKRAKPYTLIEYLCYWLKASIAGHHMCHQQDVNNVMAAVLRKGQ